jgi:subtilisin family serine protease
MTDQLQDTLAAAGQAKVLVVLKPAATPGPTAAATATIASAAVLESSLAQYFVAPAEQQLESLAEAAASAAPRARRAARAAPPPPPVRVYPRLGLALGIVSRDKINSLEADPRVREVHLAPQPSLIRPIEVRAAKPKVQPTWGIKRLKVPQLWSQGIKGKGARVAHLDTGVDGGHPAFKNAIAAFAEFDLLGNQVPNAKPTDSGEHGTHTAGTILGRAIAGRAPFGVAPEAKLVSAMVIEGGQIFDRIIGGLEWIVGQDVRILSMSLGIRGFTTAFQATIDALRRNNILPVCAVGNEFALTSRSPGNYDNVLSVGAIDRNDLVADFSSSQTFDRPNDPLVPDIVAPGVGVLSCVPGKAFAEMDGTSMATPHIAGVAALLQSARPDASASDLEAAILASCTRPSSMPEGRANRGVPDAVVALAQLTGTQAQLVA